MILGELYAEQEVKKTRQYSNAKEGLDKNIKLVEKKISKNC